MSTESYSILDPPLLKTTEVKPSPSTPAQQPKLSLRGRKISVGSMIPTSSKVGIVFYVLFAATLITLAVLMGNGSLPVDPMVATGFKFAAGIVGALLVISIPLVIYYVRKEIKNRKGNSIIAANFPQPEPQMPSSDPIRQARLPPPRISEQEWSERIQSATNTSENSAMKFFNLCEPDKPLDKVWGDYDFKMPWFGQQQEGQKRVSSKPCLLAATLPSDQLDTFPPEIKKWFRQVNAVPQECFFMVFDNRQAMRTAQKWKGSKRNLAFHALALPEYDKQNPTAPHNHPKGIKYHTDLPKGVSVDCELALFEPQGIQVRTIKQIAMGSGPKGAIGSTKLFVHNDSNGEPIIAYQPIDGTEAPQAEFEILQDQFSVSSAYFAATFRGKGVAIHALFLNDDTQDYGAKLATAVRANSIANFIHVLESGTQPFCCEVPKTFIPQ